MTGMFIGLFKRMDLVRMRRMIRHSWLNWRIKSQRWILSLAYLCIAQIKCQLKKIFNYVFGVIDIKEVKFYSNLQLLDRKVLD